MVLAGCQSQCLARQRFVGGEIEAHTLIQSTIRIYRQSFTQYDGRRAIFEEQLMRGRNMDLESSLDEWIGRPADARNRGELKNGQPARDRRDVPASQLGTRRGAAEG